MKKALLYLDEDLASSMALRFAAALAQQLDLALQAFHVVEREAMATEDIGWVSRSMEKVLLAAGLDRVNRLVRTEKIAYRQADEPRIVLGDKDQEILRELAGGGYCLYVEGYLSSPDPADFLRFLGVGRWRENPCPLLLVKNLVDHRQLLLLIDPETEAGGVIAQLSELYGSAAADIDLTVLYYKAGEGKDLVFQEQSKNNMALEQTGVLLREKGWNEPEWLVIQGSPEKAAEYMRGHGLVAASFPGPSGARAQLLAHLGNPLLLLPEQRQG